MRRFFLLLIASLSVSGCCSLCPAKIIQVPVAEPVPTIAMPVEPVYPILGKDSTPKETMEYCAEKITSQEGYIKQLQGVLAGVTKSQ
jgi:hypothetical protein